MLQWLSCLINNSKALADGWADDFKELCETSVVEITTRGPILISEESPSEACLLLDNYLFIIAIISMKGIILSQLRLINFCFFLSLHFLAMYAENEKAEHINKS